MKARLAPLQRPTVGLCRRLMVSLMVVAAVGLSACTAPRNTLGTSSSQCFRAVPVASEAVKDRGKLTGVRLYRTRDLERHPHLREDLSSRAGGRISAVCAIAFSGTFRLDQVEKPLGHGPAGGSGSFALVLVSTPQNQLLGTVVLTQLPLPLRHELLRASPRVGAPAV